MTQYKDYLGVEIVVGDVVVHGSGSYADIGTGMVTKRNPVMLQVNGNGNVNPSQCMIITDKYKEEGRYDDMHKMYKDKFQKDAKAPKPKMRYNLKIKTFNDDRVALVVNVNTDGAYDKPVESLGNFKYGTDYLIRKTEGRYTSKLTEELRLYTGYSSSPRQHELPAKMMMKFFGGIPTETSIIMTFDDMQDCKDYLTQNGVTV